MIDSGEWKHVEEDAFIPYGHTDERWCLGGRVMQWAMDAAWLDVTTAGSGKAKNIKEEKDEAGRDVDRRGRGGAGARWAGSTGAWAHGPSRGAARENEPGGAERDLGWVEPEEVRGRR